MDNEQYARLLEICTSSCATVPGRHEWFSSNYWDSSKNCNLLNAWACGNCHQHWFGDEGISTHFPPIGYVHCIEWERPRGYLK